jgi:hypothetical protein
VGSRGVVLGLVVWPVVRESLPAAFTLGGSRSGTGHHGAASYTAHRA